MAVVAEQPTLSSIGFRRASRRAYLKDLEAVTPDVDRFFDAVRRSEAKGDNEPTPPPPSRAVRHWLAEQPPPSSHPAGGGTVVTLEVSNEDAASRLLEMIEKLKDRWDILKIEPASVPQEPRPEEAPRP